MIRAIFIATGILRSLKVSYLYYSTKASIKRSNISAARGVFFLIVAAIAFVTVQTIALADDINLHDNQCASFNSLSNILHVPCLYLTVSKRLHVPCLYVDTTSYWLNLELGASGLELKEAGVNAEGEDFIECASFSFPSATLHIPCLRFDDTVIWLDLAPISSSSVILNMQRYGILTNRGAH